MTEMAMAKDLMWVHYNSLDKAMWLFLWHATFLRMILGIITNTIMCPIFRKFTKFLEHMTTCIHTDITKRRFSITSRFVLVSILHDVPQTAGLSDDIFLSPPSPLGGARWASLVYHLSLPVGRAHLLRCSGFLKNSQVSLRSKRLSLRIWFGGYLSKTSKDFKIIK